MLVAEFAFDLPPDRIATHPAEPRDSSRMLVLDRASGAIHDATFRDLPDWLRAGDLVVVNNTRVFRARLLGRRAGATGVIEALLTKRVADVGDDTWLALVRPGRKIRVGEHLLFGDADELEARVIARGEFGERTLRFSVTGDAFYAAVERVGHIPLPPYMNRDDAASDAATYQTVYARHNGSAAAPTAGLHFTPDTFARLAARGIATTEITLHVGLGTFQPVRVDVVEEHRMHAETYELSAAAAASIAETRARGGRIVAVGTTSVRTLEHSRGLAASGECNLFIYPGYAFHTVDAMLTNFHLPASTLLMLTCAFGGQSRVLAAYRHAIASGYRFYSYGDCMLLV